MSILQDVPDLSHLAVPSLYHTTEIITVTAIFSKRMEVTWVALLLLFLGAANAEDSTCTRPNGDEVFKCTECLWMSESCKFCEDPEPQGNFKNRGV